MRTDVAVERRVRVNSYILNVTIGIMLILAAIKAVIAVWNGVF